MPEFEHVIAFHVMMEGQCWAQLADESASPVRLESGDAVLFVDGQGHYLATELGRRAEPNLGLYYRPRDRELPFVLSELGGTGEPARFVCGYLGCDARPFNPIIEALPGILHVQSARDGGAQVLRSRLRRSGPPRQRGTLRSSNSPRPSAALSPPRQRGTLLCEARTPLQRTVNALAAPARDLRSGNSPRPSAALRSSAPTRNIAFR